MKKEDFLKLFDQSVTLALESWAQVGRALESAAKRPGYEAFVEDMVKATGFKPEQELDLRRFAAAWAAEPAKIKEMYFQLALKTMPKKQTADEASKIFQAKFEDLLVCLRGAEMLGAALRKDSNRGGAKF